MKLPPHPTHDNVRWLSRNKMVGLDPSSGKTPCNEGLFFFLGHVHTYPEIFFSANIFLRMRKFSRPHAAYSNRFQPSTRIRLYPEIFCFALVPSSKILSPFFFDHSAIDKIVPPCACPSWGPFLESPGNLPGPSDFGEKCFLTEANFC